MKYCPAFFLLFISYCLYGQGISPLSLGLNNTKSDIERYQVLFQTHTAAIEQDTYVDYSSIDEIHIEIPPNAKPIPLGKYTDFQGIKVFVTNKNKDQFVFSRKNEPQKLNITKDEFCSRKYLSRPELNSNCSILVIEDTEPWVDNRTGFSYGATRKDLIFIVNGHDQNSPIYPYSSPVSTPQFFCYKVEKDGGYLRNLEFIRTIESTFQSFPIQIEGQNEYIIDNITITTPKSNLYGDCAISINNCSNLQINNVFINGTYSQENKYGYGIGMNNIWNVKFDNLHSISDWGVFGNSNINNCTLKNCTINRFDIHCYGKDIYFDNCCFSNLYNQYSSVFGVISYSHCFFDNERPCLIESSYNAYTPFDLQFKNCTFIMTTEKNELVYLMDVPSINNKRPELLEKCLPNIYVKDCTIEFEEDVKEWFVFQSSNKKYQELWGHISNIYLQGIRLNIPVNCRVSNINFNSKQTVKYRVKRWKTLQQFDFKREIIKNVQLPSDTISD